MRKGEGILVLALVLLGALSLSACRKDTTGAPEGLLVIAKEALFTQDDADYYVFFYRPGCTACETVASDVTNYLTRQKETSDSALIPLYGVRLYRDSAEKGAVSPLIYREYEGKDGEGKNGTYKVSGVSAWEDLYIGSTPALIRITKGEDGVARASYVAQGANDISIALAPDTEEK